MKHYVVLLFCFISFVVASELRDKIIQRADDQIDSLVEVAASTTMPPKCVSLEEVHGAPAINRLILTTTSISPSKNPDEICDDVISCKRLIAPLITPSGQYVAKCPDDCSGNGICTNGQCACSPGYKGLNCGIMRCENNCTGHGQCKLGLCFCEPGYSGTACEKEIDCARGPDGRVCSAHGACFRGKCFCDPGFAGEKCDSVAECPRSCSNLGFCIQGKCFCPPGRGGLDCGTILAPSKCLNDCSGKGECNSGKCLCDHGHYGEDCSQIVTCPSGPNGLACSGKGSCHNGQCNCEEGRLGFTCSMESQCPGNGTCAGNGICIKGNCFCHPGFAGADCSLINPCKNGCNGKGVCVHGQCHCLPGYWGKECDKGTGPRVLVGSISLANSTTQEGGPVCPLTPATIRSLVNGGKCPNACSGTGVCLNGTCVCMPGHAGQDCSEVFDVVECPNKCSFRGVCVFGQCKCMPQYSGADCSDTVNPLKSVEDLKKCPDACSGRGFCTIQENSRGTCTCDPGYAGHNCATEVPCPDNCNGRGRCDRGKCFCYPGFSGAKCEEVAKCPGGCSARGQCFYGKCFCNSYYAGEDCSKTPHCPSGCSDNGVCLGNDMCACKPGWAGVTCTERLQCPNDCSGRGHCAATPRGVKCICNTGFMDDSCSKRVDDCGPGQCSSNGICLMGECKCDQGYNGVHCEKKVGTSIEATKVETTNPPAQQNSTTLAPRFKALEAARFKAKLDLQVTDVSELDCPNSCSEHGVCSGGQCFCNPGRTGDDCAQEVKCPNDCSGHGLCQYGSCWCGPNHVGDDCSVYTSSGSSFPTTWLTAIIAAITFFVGVIVGRKSLARSGLKFAESLSVTSAQPLQHPVV